MDVPSPIEEVPFYVQFASGFFMNGSRFCQMNFLHQLTWLLHFLLQPLDVVGYTDWFGTLNQLYISGVNSSWSVMGIIFLYIVVCNLLIFWWRFLYCFSWELWVCSLSFSAFGVVVCWTRDELKLFPLLLFSGPVFGELWIHQWNYLSLMLTFFQCQLLLHLKK